jgi:hypothetical protein
MMASTNVRFFASVAIGLMLSACASSDLRVYNSIDQNDKNITVPPGGSGLAGHLKDALQSNGWSLAIDRGPEITKGSIGETVEFRKADTFNTRYRLMLTNRWVDFCLNGQNMYAYDISLWLTIAQGLRCLPLVEGIVKWQ